MSNLDLDVEVVINEPSSVSETVPVLQNNLPLGGKKGDILKKKSDAPFDVEWSSDSGSSGSVDDDKLKSYQRKEDNALNTRDKTVVGGINEVKNTSDTALRNATSALDGVTNAVNNARVAVEKASSAETIANDAKYVSNTIANVELPKKVGKTNSPNRIYGTDESGNQVTYPTDSVGTQVLVNGQKVKEFNADSKQDVVAFDGSYDKNTNKAATVSTVTTEIAKVVANAPESFDTLEEIARWIAEHPNSVAEINAKIAQNTQSINGLSEGLNERVKFTDYATEYKSGLVRGSVDHGVIITSNGYMELYPATDEDIESRSRVLRAITPNQIDYVVMDSLVNGAWFVDEPLQAKICERLGAVHQPNVPKMNADFIVMLRANANNEKVITQLWKLSMGWDTALHEESIPVRDGDGNLYVADPTLPYHAVNKKHFDEKLGSIETALDEIIAIQNALIGTPFDELHEYAQSLIDGGEV